MLAGGSSPHLAFSLLTKDGGKWHWAAWSATLHRTARPRLCTQFPAYSQSGPLSSISLGKQHTDGSLGHRTAHTAQASTCRSRTLGGLLHFHTCGQTLGNSGLPAMCCERCPVCSFPPEQPWDSRAASSTESELTLALTKQAHRASGPHPSPQLLKHVSCRVFILQPYFQALLRSQSLYCCQSFLHPSWLCLGLGEPACDLPGPPSLPWVLAVPIFQLCEYTHVAQSPHIPSVRSRPHSLKARG